MNSVLGCAFLVLIVNSFCASEAKPLLECLSIGQSCTLDTIPCCGSTVRGIKSASFLPVKRRLYIWCNPGSKTCEETFSIRIKNESYYAEFLKNLNEGEATNLAYDSGIVQYAQAAACTTEPYDGDDSYKDFVYATNETYGTLAEITPKIQLSMLKAASMTWKMNQTKVLIMNQYSRVGCGIANCHKQCEDSDRSYACANKHHAGTMLGCRFRRPK